jgi:hypothetical protein
LVDRSLNQGGSCVPTDPPCEFKLHALFVSNRTITVSLENNDFKRTSAQGQITYGPM